MGTHCSATFHPYYPQFKPKFKRPKHLDDSRSLNTTLSSAGIMLTISCLLRAPSLNRPGFISGQCDTYVDLSF